MQAVEDGIAEAVMQCCGIVDMEGRTVSTEEKLCQALHGILVPHSKEEHGFLPTNFPSYGYWSRLQMDLVDIPRRLDMLSNEYETNHLKSAFLTLFPYGVGGFGDEE